MIKPSITMQIKNIVLVLFTSLLLPLWVKGQEMSPEQCRALALENNKAVTLAKLNKEKALYTLKAYKANYLPKFSLSGNYLYSDSKFETQIPGGYLPTYISDPATGELLPNLMLGTGGSPVMGADGNPVFNQYAFFPGIDLIFDLKNTWMAGISAEQPIYMGGKISSAYRMAQIGDRIADLNRDLTHAEVIVKADEAYWTCVKTKELIKLAESYKELLEGLLQDVQNAVEVGLKHQNDMLKVLVKLNEAELQLRRAQNGYGLALKNLCHVTGLPFDSEIILPHTFDDITEFDYDNISDISSRPEYAMLEQQILLKEQEVKLTRSDFMPNLGVAANYGYINGLELNDNKLLDATSFSALVSLKIPIFHWGEGHNKIRASEAEKNMAMLQREDLAQLMELELLQAHDKLVESALEVELTKKSLAQAQENLRVSENRYNSGMQTLSEYMEAQSMWQSAYSEYINSLSRLRLNQSYYQKAAGLL